MSPDPNRSPLRVVIAGGGVAALEAALALRELAGDRVTTTLLAPERELAYRPMSVREPFSLGAANRYQVTDIAGSAGAEVIADRLHSVDPERAVVHTGAGDDVPYGALLLATGASARARYEHAVTLDDSRIDEQLHGLIQDVEAGYVGRLGFVVPSRTPWPLPVYELALMTAARAYDMSIDLPITIATPEDAPLAAFGRPVSREVAGLLAARGIEVLAGVRCEVPAPGTLYVNPGARRIHVDRLVAMPELYGPLIPGVPRSVGGFIPIDRYGAVLRMQRVYAAGDGTDFPVKHGGIAAQQADVAAAAIARIAGMEIEPRPLDPVLHGILLGAQRPLYLRARLIGGVATDSEISAEPLWDSPAKIHARRLTACLEALDRAGATA
jgi:sulfide:quinone oxidoreductase